MSAAPGVAGAGVAPGAALATAAGSARAAAAARRAARRAGELAAARLAQGAWALHRTGEVGVAGAALLLAAAVFLLSTHLPVAREVAGLRADLAAAALRARAGTVAPAAAGPAALPALPARGEVPALLRRLFQEATRAHLEVDTGRYEIRETRRGGLVRYQAAFPVKGAYPQLRAFLDATLATLPAVALDQIALARRAVGEGDVEAQLRLTIYTRPGAAAAPPAGEVVALPARDEQPAAPPASDRVVLPAHAEALFAPHSWMVLVPLKPLALPVAPPPPPPEPTAPPFPYTLLGSFAPEGDPPVFFLLRGDRVLDAHVGDRLDGVYLLESAAAGQLVFVYLPLGVRQGLAAGGSP